MLCPQSRYIVREGACKSLPDIIEHYANIWRCKAEVQLIAASQAFMEISQSVVRHVVNGEVYDLDGSAEVFVLNQMP